MGNVAIQVDGLSKRYRIGRQQERHDTLRDAVAATLLRWSRGVPAEGGMEEGTHWALRDVSFDVRQGEVVGIIGRNGAGKSTLLKILARITEPTSGRVVLHGRVGSLLEVGTGFHPELTGRENIYLNGAILGMRRTEIERQFDEIVSFSEIEKFLDTPVKRYSSGMYVRLAFAVAAHLEPEILVVDEVLAVGDGAFQKKCLGKLGAVAQGGRTVLLVSHNMGAIRQLCNRSILLESGVLQCIGATDEIVRHYLDRGTRAQNAEFKWENGERPGDQSALLQFVRLKSASGKTSSEFGTDEAIQIEVGYQILTRLPVFNVGFSLHSSDGTYIFYTADDDMPEYAGMIKEPGEYVSCCQIPGNWLNVGTYNLHISGGIFNVRMIFTEVPPLLLTVVSTGGPTSRHSEKRRGVLAAHLPWSIRRIGP